MKLPFWKKNKIIVRKYNNSIGNSEIALLSFNGKIREQIIRYFNNRFLVEGDHIKNGGTSSPKTILSLIGAGTGSLGISAVTSGKLFMATANPATLMSIGNGVGSAVMGAGGIIGQAPFIPVTGALMPVIAPLIAFQAISTITIMNEFKVVNKKLDDIQKTVNRIIKRDEATFIGEVISASNRIAEIEEQFSISNQFTHDMTIRLALLEDKINPIFERYNYLYRSQKIEMQMDMEDLRFKQADAFMAIVSSIMDIRIDLLKMKLNIQENPGYMEKSAYQFKEKIIYYNKLWKNIKNNAEEINEIKSDMETVINDMNWWQKRMPAWLAGKREKRKDLEEKSKKFIEESLKNQIEINESIYTAMELSKAIKQGIAMENKMNLIYWRDENGENSYYTDDLLIQ
ncbi:MAG: hypothetical protein GXY77_03835 [Fibrobacter sp.]|nr:hypothetical protein [Fibrobacter sp.]